MEADWGEGTSPQTYNKTQALLASLSSPDLLSSAPSIAPLALPSPSTGLSAQPVGCTGPPRPTL
ncbi:hypothetical protein PtA15_2A856 [Puccinia triticina]|uniref:Uncharacterized protein n=1 Tax=Puccinia triticina TaxID=208348 RepID=A0ABY7CCX3_9BASI|nr:uncharacterized protein PtA15_2A856 [Puccinia triticina]WAQ82539.1 hypothetical protein PtA15_2A856 [Puccinia triticina]WAR53390.1 hypothetical protein PtB15_2B821 [Puccinia triticina]